MRATSHVSAWLAAETSEVFYYQLRAIQFMKISVKAKPNAKEEMVEKIDASHFIVAVMFEIIGG